MDFGHLDANGPGGILAEPLIEGLSGGGRCGQGLELELAGEKQVTGRYSIVRDERADGGSHLAGSCKDDADSWRWEAVMSISERDRTIIREAAKRMADIAASPAEAEKARLWKACNDLAPERPMVLATQQPRDELAAAWLRLECEGEEARRLEDGMRGRLMYCDHVPDDLPLPGVWDVEVAVANAGYDDYGFKLSTTRSDEEGGAYHIEPVIKSLDDMAGLHFRPIVIDHESTDREVEFCQDLFGDILEVRKVGRRFWRYGLSRVLIHMIGLDNMMLYMYDDPDLLHGLMGFLRDDYLNELAVFEREGAISHNNRPNGGLGSGGLAYNSALPTNGSDPCRAPLGECYCWGESQETVGVGPAQFDEFVLAYQIPLMNRFGMVDYGCCEPLDHKLDLLMEKVPHLRWVAVVPWSNRELCAEKIGGRYVYVYKPNPSHICAATPDWEAAERDVRETLQIARGCPLHIVMKDTGTFHGEAERTTRWCEMAKELAMDSVL